MHICFDEHPLLQDALVILKKLEEAGHVAYFVGGAVRDVLLSRSIHDVDIATSAKPEETLALFPRAFATGLQHGTITVVHDGVNYEVTTFRVEESYENYRRPEKVTFVNELKLDLSRRDFTMNAMAIALDGQLVDYFNGQAALKENKLVAVGNPITRFEEDALRMLRAIRFATTYKLDCDEAIRLAIADRKSLLSYISMERVQQELFKVAANEFKIADFKLLYASDLLNYTKRKLHLHSALELCFNSCEDICSISFNNAISMWAALYHYGQVNEKDIQSDLSALVFSKKMASAVKLHIEWLNFFKSTTEALEDVKQQSIYIENFEESHPYYAKLALCVNGCTTVTEKFHLYIKLYWLEQLQKHAEAYMSELSPFIQASGYNQLIPMLEQIENNQKLKKLSSLSCSAIELQKLIDTKSQHYIKEFLQLTYLAVNISHINNSYDEILTWWKFLIVNEVVFSEQ